MDKNLASTLRHSVAIRPFLLLILIVSLAMAFRILQPFLNPIILAVVLAALFNPVQRRLRKVMPKSKNLCALVMVLLISVVIILPLLVFLTALVDQAIQVSAQVKEWMQSGELQNLEQNEYVVSFMSWLEAKLPFVDFDSIDFKAQFLKGARFLSEGIIRHSAGVVGNVAVLLTSFFVMMFIVFYLLRDGEGMIGRIKHLSPLREEQENRIFEKVSAVSRSVFLGSLLTAFVQGLVAGLAMAIVGIPALFWGTMLAFASLVPVVGTAIIWIPATGYLLLIGSWKSAIFFAIWCAAVVGSIDNFLRPYLMRGQAGMSPFYIFLAILGGVQIFGLAGLLYGPLSIGFATIMLLIYEEEFHSFLVEKDQATQAENKQGDTHGLSAPQPDPSQALKPRPRARRFGLRAPAPRRR